MAHYIGIDLGTTYSAVAFVDPTGRPQIVNNDRDRNITPSVIAKYNDELVIGEFARRHWGNDEKKGAARFKRDMGTSIHHEIDGQKYSATELSAAILKTLKKNTEDRIGPIEEAVVTIPANFSHEARDATMEAARLAGLKIKHIINEPTAAALYYAFESEGELSGTCVVFDLGGGTFDVSIIRVLGQDIEVLASNGLHKLGGADFDHAIWKLVAEKYLAETGKTLTNDEFSMNDAESVKIALSERKRTTVEIEREFIDISRIEFEESISTLIAQIEMMCESTLEEAEIEVDEITNVFFAGGSTRTPAIIELAEKIFKMEPISSINVDEVVALGAALYAAHKSDGKNLTEIQKKAMDQVKVSEVTNSYFGTITIGYSESKGHSMMNSILIRKGEKIPCEVKEVFFTSHDGQESIKCSVTESKAAESDPRFVKIVHEEKLALPPGRPEGQEIEVTYSYDINQMIKASFKDVASGKETEISISVSGKTKTSSEIDKFLVE